MVRLLKAQETCVTAKDLDLRNLIDVVLERLLEVYPSNLAPEEDAEIEQTIKEWLKD